MGFILMRVMCEGSLAAVGTAVRVPADSVPGVPVDSPARPGLVSRLSASACRAPCS